jgi:hypothetical protein
MVARLPVPISKCPLLVARMFEHFKGLEAEDSLDFSQLMRLMSIVFRGARSALSC